MLLKIPTAWLQLRYQKTRLLAALGGVVFSVVIIFMQFGLRDALFDSSVRLYRALDGDCFLISPRSPSLVVMDHFPERRLAQALALDGVESVTPLYLRFVQWRNLENPNSWRNIFVIGFDLRQQVFNLPGVQENFKKLQLPDAVLFDRNSRIEYGPVASIFDKNKRVETEVRGDGQNRKLKVVGLFDLGTSFGIDGNLIVSDLNFKRIFINQQKGFVNLGVVKLNSEVDVINFTQNLRKVLPKDVRVLSQQELIDFEKDYWNRGTPIGFIFLLGVVLGLVVGIVVVYQILYANVTENLPQYATLKAIGYGHQYLLSIVLQQSMFIAILGYIPGFLMAELLYNLTRQATLLPISMNFPRAISVFSLTAIMCFLAGATAMRKLKAADPADIF